MKLERRWEIQGKERSVPFEWCQSIRFSSLRACVRFSSWSWRWMFSSIKAWMVSWSSKPRLLRDSRARGRNNNNGLKTLIPGTAYSLENKKKASTTSSQRPKHLSGTSKSHVEVLRFTTEMIHNGYFISLTLGEVATESFFSFNLEVERCQINPIFTHQWAQLVWPQPANEVPFTWLWSTLENEILWIPAVNKPHKKLIGMHCSHHCNT